MKPRNKYEKKVQEIVDSGKLTMLTDAQKRYICKVYQRGRWDVSTMQTIDGLWVQKIFECHIKKNRISFCDLTIVRVMFPDFKIVNAAKRPAFCQYYDAFCHATDIEVRSSNALSYNCQDRYTLIGRCDALPNYSAPKWVKKRGFTGKAMHDPFGMIQKFNKDSRLETMFKNGCYDLAEYFLANSNSLDEYWSTIKIAMKHKYKIVRVASYIDMLDCLKSCGKDIRNAYYVCPKSFDEMHDKWIRKFAKTLSDKDADDKLLELGDEEAFKRVHKGKLGIKFEDDRFVYKSLDSISAFKKEADAMKHCVYANKYYKKRTSIILSVRDKRDKRVETVEYDIVSRSVIQNYGYNDRATRYSRYIKSYVNQEMPRILDKRHMLGLRAI